MIERDVIIVGGGPADSSAAWRLVRAGVDCLVLDRAPFPREKLCAGWVTPEALRDLEIDPAEYPHRLLTFDALRIRVHGVPLTLRSPQHSIRRVEFDQYLLQRSGAEHRVHRVRNIRADGNGYVIDEAFRCRYLIGAGGSRCPVHRAFFREAHPHDKALQAVTLELEFPCDWQNPDCHLWFLEHRLPGYAWYVPKADGYLNVGIGAMARKLASRKSDIRGHWQRFIDTLTRKGLITTDPGPPDGYSYFLRSATQNARLGRAFVVGDAAGLATRDMCEGIGPAIRSGIRAAESIVTGDEHSLQSIDPYTSQNRLVSGFLDYAFHGRALNLVPEKA